MPTILEELQARTDEAKKRLDEVTKTLQVAQQAMAVAQHTFTVWSMALQTEMRDQQIQQAAANENQLPLPTTKAPQVPTVAVENQPIVDESEGVNKTDIVRDLLHSHPAGMTAIEIWRQVSDRFKHRPYLYSVLKRLRDRDEIVPRRGKYFLKLATRVEDSKEQQSMVH